VGRGRQACLEGFLSVGGASGCRPSRDKFHERRKRLTRGAAPVGIFPCVGYDRFMSTFTMTPVGTVRATRSTPGDDGWDAETCSIELDPAQFTAEALTGLDAFSHVEVVYVFDRVDPRTIERAARHPRHNPAWPKVGIFAQRGKNRPNRIGTTVCRIDRIEGLRLHVAGLDAIDGTPVLDIKPWVKEFGPRGEVRQPAWMGELMAGYWSATA
jgi:tRNA (adenine37-N6)-methyltransferase